MPALAGNHFGLQPKIKTDDICKCRHLSPVLDVSSAEDWSPGGFPKLDTIGGKLSIYRIPSGYALLLLKGSRKVDMVGYLPLSEHHFSDHHCDSYEVAIGREGAGFEIELFPGDNTMLMSKEEETNLILPHRAGKMVRERVKFSRMGYILTYRYPTVLSNTCMQVENRLTKRRVKISSTKRVDTILNSVLNVPQQYAMN
jgi:hypothetical protein